MGLYDRVADLSLSVDSFALERHEMETSAGFTRVSTVVELQGPGTGERSEHGGEAVGLVGRGEDVTYETADHDRLLDAHGAGDLDWDLAGEYTLDSFSPHLDGVDLFPEPPEQETFRHYRRWAVESAALDLALRQAGTTFADAVGESYDPVRFVVSTRLDTGEEPSADRIHEWLDVDPSLEVKLDPTGEWDDDLVADLAATGRVRILDFKGFYEGTEVDAEPDPDLYGRVADAFPDRRLYRYEFRGVWAPYAGSPDGARLQRVRDVRGERVAFETTLGVPDRAVGVTARLAVDGRSRYRVLAADEGSVSLGFVVENESVAFSDASGDDAGGSADGPLTVADRETVLLTVFIDYGALGGFSYRFDMPVDAGDDRVRALTPGVERCRGSRACDGAAAYVPDIAPDGVFVRTNLTVRTATER